MTRTDLNSRLMALRDDAYKDFQCKLIPTVSPEVVLGIRIPELRSLALEIWDSQAAADFLAELPHHYYDENNLHSIILSGLSDFDEVSELLEFFLPHVDNWATCDLIRPRVFRGQLERLLPKIRRWLRMEQVYTVRFALEMLMIHGLDSGEITGALTLALGVEREEYYIQMMMAWFFATALAKNYDQTIPFLRNHILPVWIHNKTIQKAVESRMISPERKHYLKTLRISSRCQSSS